jgi:hypothetical protein
MKSFKNEICKIWVSVQWIMVIMIIILSKADIIVSIALLLLRRVTSLRDFPPSPAASSPQAAPSFQAAS